MICEQSATSGGALVADLYVQGVWVSQAETLLDIHVVDTDTQSYHDRTPMAVLHTAEHDKKQKYSQACQACRATFTPLCVSDDGMLGCETTAFLKRIGYILSTKWKMDYGTVMGC